MSGEPNETHPVIEIFIGGWQNSKSIIRYNQTKPEVAEAQTPGILNENELRGFWVRATDGVSISFLNDQFYHIQFYSPQTYDEIAVT